MEIKFFDFARILKPHKQDILSNIEKIFDTGIFILGEDVGIFEKKARDYISVKNTIGVSSGTDALLATFMSLGLNPGDEVLVTPFTFMASVSSIIRAGLKPVFVDISENSFHPGVDDILNAWTPKTKAVLYVHLFGEAIEMESLRKECDIRDAKLIEDCAQSFGSRYADGSHVGTVGHAAAFSFFPAKNLGCLGDGGLITTNDDDLAEKIRMIRSHGSKKRYYHDLLGGNFRLDTIQAAALNVLIDQVDGWVDERKKNAKYYLANIQKSDIIEFPKDYDGNSWNQFVIRTSERETLQKYLTDNGVQTFVYWPLGLHKQDLFRGTDLYSDGFKETEKRCNEVLALPVYPALEKEERQTIVRLINQFIKERR